MKVAGKCLSACFFSFEAVPALCFSLCAEVELLWPSRHCLSRKALNWLCLGFRQIYVLATIVFGTIYRSAPAAQTKRPHLANKVWSSSFGISWESYWLLFA